MFSNPAPVDKSLTEGIVTEVDTLRNVCKVKTQFNKQLIGVRWLIPSGGASRSGIRTGPTMGDMVVIDSRLGSPLIIGYLPKSQSNAEAETSQQSLCNNSRTQETGNFTSSPCVNAGIDVNKPSDQVSGDHIIQTQGGGLLAMLRGGSVLLRSSSFSEFFLSRWSSLARLVSDNFEHFTSLSTDVIKNYRGRVYRYTGYAKNYVEAKTETYRYHEFTGDTSIAEGVKATYNSPLTMPPAANTILRKEQVTDPVAELMHHTLDLDGTDEVVVKNSGGTSFTRIKQTNGVVTITFNDTSLITLDTSSITISRDGVTKTVHDATGIHMVENGGASAFLSNNVINLTAANININGTTLVSGNTTISSGSNSFALSSASTVSNTTIQANVLGNLTGNASTATHANLASALG